MPDTPWRCAQSNPRSPMAKPGRLWHRRARHALGHSLRVRLVALFLVLAMALAVTFIFGMQKALSVGWREAARPLVSDYVDRLVVEIGSPPSIARAQALTQRLPVSVHISGPMVNWRSDTQAHVMARSRGQHEDWQDNQPRLLSRTTADGHRIDLGISVTAWENQPHRVGWFTLAGILALTALAAVRLASPFRCAVATNWVSWPATSTPWPPASTRCSKPSGACCWPSATSCAVR